MSAAAPVPINPFSVETLSAKALEILGAEVPTANSILRIAAKLAQLVNKAPSLHGPQKAALVQQVLREILNSPIVRPKLDAAAVDALNVVIDTVVPTALTLIISAGRGEFDLKKPREALLWCCRSAASVAVAAAAAHTVPAEKGPEPVVAPEQVETAVAPLPASEVAPVASTLSIESNENPAPAPVPAAPSTN